MCVRIIHTIYSDADRIGSGCDLQSRSLSLTSLPRISQVVVRHVPLARQMLRKLLDGYILCGPIMEGGRAGYRFTATGTFDRLLTGFKVVNENGGGHPLPDLFRPTIRVSLRVPQAEAKRANAKQ